MSSYSGLDFDCSEAHEDCGAILRKYTKNTQQDACSTFKDSLATADYTELAVLPNTCVTIVADPPDEDFGVKQLSVCVCVCHCTVLSPPSLFFPFGHVTSKNNIPLRVCPVLCPYTALVKWIVTVMFRED